MTNIFHRSLVFAFLGMAFRRAVASRLPGVALLVAVAVNAQAAPAGIPEERAGAGADKQLYQPATPHQIVAPPFATTGAGTSINLEPQNGANFTAAAGDFPLQPPAAPVQGPQPADESTVKAVAGAFLLLFALATVIGGIMALLLLIVPCWFFAHWIFPDGRAYLLFALLAAAWCALRWRLIKNNVRQYHLQDSISPRLTWAWYLLAPGVAVPGESFRSSDDDDDGWFSFSFSTGGGGEGNGDSADSGSSDNGGADS